MRWRRRREPSPDEVWFRDHYTTAPAQIEEFLLSAGVSLEGRAMADVGCGDGIMALGVVHRVRPAVLVGFDVNPVDRGKLLERARKYGVAETLPDQLDFRESDPIRLPAESATFDVVYTWSAFEHVGEPTALLREVRRVLKPDGALMLQLWPFYHSARGSHLWDWFPESFHHLVHDEDEVIAAMRASDRHPPEWTEYMIREFLSLNRVTLAELQRSLLAADLEVRKLELMSEAAHIPPVLNRFPLSHLGVSGVKLIAGAAGRAD